MHALNFRHQAKITRLVIRMNARSLFAQKSTWTGLFLFALTLLVLFPFALGTDALRRFDVQIGCYWIIQEFLAALIISNMFKIEDEGHVFDIYAATRTSKLSFFLGKVIFTTMHFLSLQFATIVLWAIIFNLNQQTLVSLLPTLVISSVFFSFTASLLGAFLYGITTRNSIKEILQPLLFFPLQSASLLASVGVCLDVQMLQTPTNLSAWWNIIIMYPVLFVGLSFIFADVLLEK